MPSPICTVNTNQTLNGVDVAGGSNVIIQLADLAGVVSWSIQCLNTDDVNTPVQINSMLNIINVTKTATFTSPSSPNGSALIFESKVNNGLDANGRVDQTLVTRFGIFVLTGGGNRLFAFDEKLESNATFGWLKKINDVVRDSVISIGSLAGLGLYYSGGAYNVGAADDSITINADSIQLKALYKTLLDAKATIATPNTLAYRGASAEIAFNATTVTTLGATGQISTTAATPSGISSDAGDITALRFAVKETGTNTLILRKDPVIATTVDVQAINAWALRITTENSSANSRNIDVLTGSVVTGFTSGALNQKTGSASQAGQTGIYTCGSGNSAGGATGNVICSTGSTIISGSSGNLNLETGSVNNGSSGIFIGRTGATGLTGISGACSLGSGNTINGSTGQATLSSGTASGSGATGPVVITSGDSATGNTGNIQIICGDSAGSGAGGNINLVGGIGTSGGNISLVGRGGGTRGGSFSFVPGPGLLNGNYYFGTNLSGAGGDSTAGGGVFCIRGASTAPSGNTFTNTVQFWFEGMIGGGSGSMKIRFPGGTIRTVQLI